MNGYELAKKLRAMPRLNDVRLVALAGYGQRRPEAGLPSDFTVRVVAVRINGHFCTQSGLRECLEPRR
jgi:hypothetical protein